MQSVVDFLASSLYMVNSLVDRFLLDQQHPCYMFYRRITVWLLTGLRGALNFSVATHSFIQLVYPFVHVSIRRGVLVILGGFSVTFTLFTMAVAHLDSSETDRRCAFVPDSLVDYVGFVRVFHLITFVYQFLFPLTASAYMYHKIFDTIRGAHSQVGRNVYKELWKTRMCDVYLFLFCVSPAHICAFLVRMHSEKTSYSNSRLELINTYLMIFYHIASPIYSLTFRRSF
ncbi:uncharacterized protein DEA37_0007624, partial [Paragonimus westermani]